MESVQGNVCKTYVILKFWNCGWYVNSFKIKSSGKKYASLTLFLYLWQTYIVLIYFMQTLF